ncbi:MAG TPA: helix-turn-helix domain-containing protein [Burkholderiales bacterium]|nr:helix-turn-helix domain-containing protein [Burkholderiales bacterium]
MSRNREFDPEEALGKAMQLFWQKGYDDTSMDDVVEATGVSRYGIYSEFGSKRELFLAAMDHYQERIAGSSFGIVEQPDASLGEILRYFSHLAEALSGSRDRLGCLMCNAATEVAPRDEDVRKKVEFAMNRLSAGFRSALCNAMEKGEIAPDLDTAMVCDFLTGTVLGASVMARSGAVGSMIENAIAMALRSILPKTSL